MIRRPGTGLYRRTGSLRGAGLDPFSDFTFKGIGGADTTNLFGTVAGGGYRGNTAGWTGWTLAQIDTGVLSGQLNSYLDGTGKGYYLYQPSTTTIAFRAGNAAGNAFVESPASTITPYLGKIQLFVYKVTGAPGVVDLFASRTKVGSGTATTGYTQPATSLRHTMLVRNNGTAAHTGATVYAWGAFNSVLSDAEILALYDTLYATGRLPASGHVQYCNVLDNATTSAVPSPVVDQGSGASNFTVYSGSVAGLDLVTRTGPPSSLLAWSPADYPVRDALLAYGDSMTGGRGTIANAPAGYEPASGVVMVKSVSAGFEALNEPCGDGASDTTGVGYVGLLGWRTNLATGRDCVVINAGKGGSTTAQWVPGQAHYTEAVNEALYTVARTNTLLRGIVVYIGPNDVAQVSEPDWLGNTQSTLAGIRSALGKTAAQLPAVIVQLPAAATGTWITQVKADIAAIADANHIVVQAPAATLDSVHHTTPENYTIAQLVLAALQSHSSWVP